MIRLADEWKFYQDKNGQWQWRKYIANKVVAVSFDSFPSRKECIGNAGKRGYVAPPKKYRYSKVGSSSF
jgi:uncharacterized protein YegP (UPF0339 family)